MVQRASGNPLAKNGAPAAARPNEEEGPPGRRGWWWPRPVAPSRDHFAGLCRLAAGRDKAADEALQSLSPDHNCPTLSPEQRQFFATMASLSVVTEDLGGIATENLLRLEITPLLRARIVRAMWDEIRHASLFNRIAGLGELDEDHRTWAETSLTALLDEALTDTEFVILHTELEALALDVFQLIHRHVGDPLIANIYRVVARDESSHVALGLDLLHLVAHGHDVPSSARVSELFDIAATLSPIGQPVGHARLCDVLSIDPGEALRQLGTRRQSRSERVLMALSAEDTERRRST